MKCEECGKENATIVALYATVVSRYRNVELPTFYVDLCRDCFDKRYNNKSEK